MERLIAGRLLRDVSIVDLVRRSFTVAPRLFLLLLPILAPIFLAAAYGAVTIGFTPGDSPSPVVRWGGAAASQERAETATAIVAGVSLALAALLSPAVAACVSVAAVRAGMAERARFPLLVSGLKRAWPAPVLGGLGVGALSLVGYGLCFVPGLVVLGFLLPVTVVAAAEQKGLGVALDRGLALTRGSRFRLAAAMFLLWFFSGIALRLTDLAAPRSIRAGESTTHLWVYAAFVGAAAMFTCVWQAALAALAYNDLRIRSEGLEIDAVAVELGGRAVVGPDRDAEAVSENALVLRQRARKTIVVMVAAGLGLGVSAIVFYPIVKGKLDERAREQQYQRAAEEARLAAEAWARENPPEARDRQREERERAAQEELARQDPRDRPEEPPALPPPPKTEEEIVAALQSPDRAERRRALAEDLAPISKEIWGAGLSSVLKQPHKRNAKLELAILPAISQTLSAAGCGEALSAARDLEEDRASAAFAKACPPAPEPRAIDPKLMKGVPLWAGALALTLEIRAKDFDKQKHAVHKAAKAALLRERVAGD